MLTRSKEEITLISKEELMANTAPLALVHAGLMSMNAVIRNMTKGEDAVNRNTVIRVPFKETIGFDLYYRFELDTEEGFVFDDPSFTVAGETFGANTRIAFKDEESAYEALDRLRQATPGSTSAINLNHNHFTHRYILEGMLDFHDLFGRFPKDSEDAKIRDISRPLELLKASGVRKAKYPLKALRKFDEFNELVTYDLQSQNDAQEGVNYGLFFKLATISHNFDVLFGKLSRFLQKYIDDMDAAENVTNSSTSQNVWRVDPDAKERNTKERLYGYFMNIIEHISFVMTAKQEQFFLKYYQPKRVHELVTLMKLMDEPSFPASGNWSVYEAYLEIAGALALKIEVVEKMVKRGFKWEELTTVLPDTRVTNGKVTVRMLDAQDPTALALGQLTHCCQGLHGAGETCMFEGLVNPYSGFLVFESENQIIAQSWVWQASNGALVLDNIEFANFKNTNSIIDALIEWITVSPYDNIQVGLGYMEIQLNAPLTESEDMAWYKQQLWSKQLYTDAESRLSLKKDGTVLLNK